MSLSRTAVPLYRTGALRRVIRSIRLRTAVFVLVPRVEVGIQNAKQPAQSTRRASPGVADVSAEQAAGTANGPRPGIRVPLLSGVRVLDLTGFLAGPFGSMILADLGATVLKVERPGGDATRANPPYYVAGESAYFISANRNKDSIVIDLKTPEGREILERLVVDSDIVLDNLRAQQREALGLSFERLRELNPGIVSCSVTGFGSDGPYSQRPAYDIIVEALAGVMSLTGAEDGPSVRAGVPIGDIAAGLYLAIAALAGLEHRRRTGEGQHLDVSMLDSQVSLLSYLAQYYFSGGLIAGRQGRAHVSIPTYNTFPAIDGTDVVIAANTEAMWRSLCRVLDREDLIEDARFLTNADRLRHREEIVPILRDEVSRREVNELIEALIAAGVPSAPINTIDRALSDPQVVHRDMVVTFEHHSGETISTLGVPIKGDLSGGEPFSSSPALGAQTREVLERLGYDESEIISLGRAGVVVLGEGEMTKEVADEARTT